MTDTELITRDMTIGDITEAYPQSAEIFMEYGLHCVGCHVAFWETLEEGARGHGMDEETIDCMVRDANTIANETAEQVAKQNSQVKITQAAVNRAKEMIKKEDKVGHVFRIAVIEGGCSGFSYQFTLEKEPKEEDEFISQDELLIVVDKISLERLSGCIVDYIDTMATSGFKVSNPQASTTCGCGSSFA